MILKFIFWYLHKMYLKKTVRDTEPHLWIRGVGRDYPKYLIYTEDEAVYKRLDKFV